jgi:hypothetical protein
MSVARRIGLEEGAAPETGIPHERRCRTAVLTRLHTFQLDNIGLRAPARHRLMIWAFYPLAPWAGRVCRAHSVGEIGYFRNLIQILTYIGPSWTLKREATIIARRLRGKTLWQLSW